MTKEYYYIKPLKIGRPCSASRKVGPSVEAAVNYLSEYPESARRNWGDISVKPT